MRKLSVEPLGALPFAGLADDRLLAVTSSSVSAVQHYLDALPIAAGIAVQGAAGPRLLAGNLLLARMRDRLAQAT